MTMSSRGRQGFARGKLPGGRRLVGGLAVAALAALLASGCGDRTGGPYADMAAIVAEEDARSAIGLRRIHDAREGSDPALRALAVRALGRLEDPLELDHLADALLEDPDAGVRVAAATAMVQAISSSPRSTVADADSIWARARSVVRRTLALQAVVETDPRVLGALAANLGRMVPYQDPGLVAEGLATLAERLPDTPADPAHAAHLGFARGIKSLARLAPPLPPDLARAATALLAFGLDAGAAAATAPGSDPVRPGIDPGAARIRRLAVAALAPGGQLEDSQLRDLMADPDWGVRRQAVLATARTGADAGWAARAGLRDVAPEVRLEALAAYDRWLRADDGCGPIVRAVDDPNPHVADRATELLAAPCPDREGQRRALAARAGDLGTGIPGGGDWRGAARALHALAGSWPREAEAGIGGLARHPDPFARAWAARGAAVAGMTGLLIELAGDPVANVREAALRGLNEALADGPESLRGEVRELHLAQLEADDPQLVMTAVRQLATAPDPSLAPALVAALARFTARQRQTERDVRVALLEGLRTAGGFTRDDLAPYLADFDPAVASLAATILTETTGDSHRAAPEPLSPTPTPGPERLRELARTTVVLHMTDGAAAPPAESGADAPHPATEPGLAGPGPGAIAIRLRPDLAATNADRFARLAASGFLDGLTFHRVEPNFVIQGGGPNANEYSGDGPYTRDEISDHPHWRGAVGLSTRGRDTGDGQLFINLADNVRLDFNYTIFGEVVEGMEVVDAVRAGATIERAEVIRPAPADSAAALARRVEIRRNGYGVPHILAEDLAAMGFALGFVQSEDYGASIATGMVASRGELSRHLGPDELDADFAARETHGVAVANFHRLDPRTRDVYRGFAEGVNHYIRLHPEEFPPWIRPDFTGIDALARDVQSWSRGDAARFRTTLASALSGGGSLVGAADSGLRARWSDEGRSAGDLAARKGWLLDGSNAWAFHGDRTESGHAILLRNPHLRWEGDHDLLDRPSGLTYYEAQVRVPGVIEFHGDFRIGTAFGIIGGFNANLGWATTNNSPTLSQVYDLEGDPALDGHARLDGGTVGMTRRDARVDYLRDDGTIAAEVRTQWRTPHGPVIGNLDERVFVLKDPRDGVFRRGEQFLRMMMSASLDEWLAVMRMRAHPTSNFTYADREGNIAHYYNARLPLLPHPVTGRGAARASTAAEIWSELVPWEDLPLYLNPPGGYVQQANDPPDFTNLNVPLDRDTVAANLPEPRLRLRSQLSLELAAQSGRLTPERVIELKHSPRILMAERVMDDLLEAARGRTELAGAVAVLEAWDRTAAAGSRGGALFERWAELYFGGALGAAPEGSRWRERWDPARPAETPAGLGDFAAAREALAAAASAMEEDGLALDLAWGDLHRVVRGDVDEPVAGCPATLGCFRVLSFATLDDGRRAANRGDAWVLVVEFAELPRAWTVLAYGQTARRESPHYADQAALFARGEMKPVAWSEDAVLRQTVRRYRPGG